MNYSPQMHASHSCPGRCGAQVQRHLFACRACWRRLPTQYRTPIVTTHWASDDIGHSRAMVDAMHWFGTQSVERGDPVTMETDVM
jgi:hypothetical protein